MVAILKTYGLVEVGCLILLRVNVKSDWKIGGKML
jgi:hypothetical protein